MNDLLNIVDYEAADEKTKQKVTRDQIKHNKMILLAWIYDHTTISCVDSAIDEFNAEVIIDGIEYWINLDQNPQNKLLSIDSIYPLVFYKYDNKHHPIYRPDFDNQISSDQYSKFMLQMASEALKWENEYKPNVKKIFCDYYESMNYHEEAI